MSSKRKSRNSASRLGNKLASIFSKSSRTAVDEVHAAASPDPEPSSSSRVAVPAQTEEAPPTTTVNDPVSASDLAPSSPPEISGPAGGRPWAEFRGSLRGVQHGVGPIFPVLGDALVRFLGLADTLEESIVIGLDMEELRASLQEAADGLQKRIGKSGSSESIKQRLEGTASMLKAHLDDLGDSIQKRKDRSSASQRSTTSEDARDLKKIVSLVEKMWKDFERDTMLDIDAKVDKTATTLEKFDEDGVLSKALRPVEQALVFSGQGKGCMTNTRVSILEDLRQWVIDRDAAPIYWLNGMAGIGKSSVAQSFCLSLSKAGLLAACFFCSRQGAVNQDDVSSILPTIAYRMARKYPSYRSKLMEAIASLGQDRDPYSLDVGEQFRLLMETPALSPFGARGTTHVVVVDALDECQDSDAVDSLLDKVLGLSTQLPIKFFLTSRREAWLQSRFSRTQTGRLVDLRLDQAYLDSTSGDIRLYLEAKLREIASRSPLLPSGEVWPTNTQLERLVELSGKLFIFASTVIKYLGEKKTNPAARLRAVFEAHAELAMSNLDEIYRFILSDALKPLEKKEAADLNRCLATVVCARRALSVEETAELLDLQIEEVEAAFQGLHSVVSFPSSQSDIISIFHASFQDYVTDINRSDTAWLVDSPSHHRELSKECLRLMGSLKFNITQTKSSYIVFDGRDPEQSQIRNVSGALYYSCRYLVDHLKRSVPDAGLLGQVWMLLKEKFLYWLEVLSVLRATHIVGGLLHVMKGLFQHMKPNVHALPFFNDAIEFVYAFRDLISTSPAHIYISALPFTHEESLVTMTFRKHFQNLLVDEATNNFRKQHPVLILDGYKLEGWCSAVAFSPDGSHLVSASRTYSPHDESTIYVWNANTGEEVSPCFRVSGDVEAPDGGLDIELLAMSADNGHILAIFSSGRDNGRRYTAWYLDIQTSSVVSYCILEISESGLGRAYYSSVFLRDGKWTLAVLVVGQPAAAIHMWDVRTGVRTSNTPLGSVSGYITSAAFSHDGSRVVTGYITLGMPVGEKRTVRVWDVHTGKEAGPALGGHSLLVTFLAFSHDGNRLAALADDGTIRVWDIQSGEEVCTIKPQARSLFSVGFLVDSDFIVFGSVDQITIWDIGRGAAACPPLELRTTFKMPTCVAVSPRGDYIASGGSRGGVHVWEVQIIGDVFPTLDGHTKGVKSVGFSPDGRCIVSAGGRDHTIRLWDVQTGERAFPVLHLSCDSVNSAAFSPDGRCIASGSVSRDQSLLLWNVPSAKQGFGLSRPITFNTKDNIHAVLFSPDGTRIISRDSRRIQVWNALTGEEVYPAIEEDGDNVMSVAISPDGSRILSGFADGTIRLWDLESGERIGPRFESHNSRVLSPAFLPHGVLSLAYSPHGDCIVAGSSDSTLRTWNAQTGKQIHLANHDGAVNAVAFSPDGRYIVSGSGDWTVRLWDTLTGTELWRGGHASYVNSVAFSPTGSVIASGSGDNTIRIWDLLEVELLRIPTSDASLTIPELPMSTSGEGQPRTDDEESSSGHGRHSTTTREIIRPGTHYPHKGWAVSAKDEPLFHIPEEYRAGFFWPGTKHVMGAHPCKVDLSRFVHGEDWYKCYTG